MASRKRNQNSKAAQPVPVQQNNSLSFSNISHSELNEFLPPLPSIKKAPGSNEEESSQKDDSAHNLLGNNNFGGNDPVEDHGIDDQLL